MRKYTYIKDKVPSDVINLYLEEKSLAKVADYYNISIGSLYNFLKKNNVDTTLDKVKQSSKVRKYKFDENYFENIDTRNKAYITGLLHSDGFINIKSNQVRLKLTDLELVKKVSDVIYENGRKLYFDSSTKENHKPNLSLVVTSNKFMNDCIKHGCVHQKTFNLKFPTTIPEPLMGDYLRGMFDGDGCVHVNNNFKYRPATIKIVATKNWSLGLVEWLKERDIKSTIYDDKRHDDRVTGFTISNVQDVIKFYYLIYNNIENELFLDRKYEKYKDYINFKIENTDEYINLK